MNTFINPTIPLGEPGHVWQFDDDVRVEVSTVTVGDIDNPTTEERRQFFTPHGAKLNVPDTLVPGELPVPPEPTMQEVQDAKIAEINRDFSAAAAALTDGYPPEERLTWPVQQQEAFAWQADPQAPTPYLDGLAASRGIDPNEMRAKTLEQTLLFMQGSQYLVGKRQRLRDAVYKAGSTVDAQKISWNDE